MSEGVTVGVDLGGTNIKAVAMSPKMTHGDVLTFPTPSDAGSAGVIDAIVSSVREAVRSGDGGLLTAVGIGTPGLVDEALTIRGAAVNLPDWERFSLKSVLERRLGVPVWGGNDVGLAAIAEYELGAGQDAKVLVCIWLGTGIGGGILIDGVPFRGHGGIGGEIGHVVVFPQGRRCNCGQSGCAEAYASATGMLATFRDLDNRAAEQQPSLSDFALALRAGLPAAVEAHGRAVDALARLTGSLLNVLAPDRVVFGGGVVQSGIPIIDPLRTALPLYALPAIRGQCGFRLSTLGAEAGPLGAALLARRRVRASSEVGPVDLPMA